MAITAARRGSVTSSLIVAVWGGPAIALRGLRRQPQLSLEVVIQGLTDDTCERDQSYGRDSVRRAAPSMAQQTTSDIAYVEAVSGRVVAAGRENPMLVEALEVISEQTRFDLLPNSELRFCHYHMQRFLTVKGPARVTVSADGITVEAGKAAVVSQDTCGFALASKFQGGFLTRGGSLKK